MRRWRHRLSVVRLGERRCRYTDEVEIDAGALTGAAIVIAQMLYRYRHRRWAGLARVATMGENLGRAVQGAGCGAAPAGPVPPTLDLTRHRRTPS